MFQLTSAQDLTNKYSYSSSELNQFTIIESPTIQVKEKSRTIQAKQADMRFEPLLIHPISHNLSENDDELQKIKEKRDFLKQSEFGIKNRGQNDDSPLAPKITIGRSFYADIDGACPNDNTIAISNGGRIISMMNEYVGIYNRNGAKLNFYTLNEFFNFSGSLCDPKVEYDPVADRFFAYIQACGSVHDRIGFAFSSTNDPNGSWHIYEFDSDAFGDNSWSDYPKVAINRDEVFVSVNLFEDVSNGKYKQSIVYQLNKTEGYNGNSIHYKIWSGFKNGTLLPIRSGSSNQYGPGIYLVQSTAGGSDFINYYDITGKLGDANAKLLYQKLNTTSYEPSGNAYQYGTSVRLDVGDCRMQDGYYLNGIIHFVFSADDQGYSGIRYHRLDPTLLNINNFQIFSASDERDFCYPSIAPFSNTTGDLSSIIHFASSGVDYYPDMRAKLYFNDFTSASSIRVHTYGPNQTCATNGVSRWGDYSGIAKVYNSSTPTVWIAGSLGSTVSYKWVSYIAELYSSPDATSSPQIKVNTSINPLPVTNRLNYTIELSKKTTAIFTLIDENGHTISKIFEGTLLPGENKFSFSTNELTNGTYYLRITSTKNELIKTEKILIAH